MSKIQAPRVPRPQDQKETSQEAHANVVVQPQLPQQESTDQSALYDIMQRLNKLEKENQELKDQAKGNTFKEEEYAGPIVARYKMRDIGEEGEKKLVPIVSYVKYRDKKNLGDFYNIHDVEICNIMIKMTLLGGETVTVNRTEFIDNLQYSDFVSFGAKTPTGLIKEMTTEMTTEIAKKNLDIVAYVVPYNGQDIDLSPNCIN